MKTKRRLLCLLLAFAMLMCMPSFVLADEQQARQGAQEYSVLDTAAQIVENYFKFGTSRNYLLTAALYEKLTNPDADVEDMLTRMMGALDPHSSYLSCDDYQYWLNHTISGEFGGIGVSIVERNGRVVVVSPIADTPAQAAGILPNDIIISVNGESMTGKSVEYLQTAVAGEIGTSVNIGILRGNEELYFDISRAVIKDETVSFYSTDDNIGVLHVSKFNGTTVEDTKKALTDFDAKGITKIVIDLRNNPGGELNSVVEFCGLFVPKGVVVSMKYKDSTRNEIFYSDNENPKYSLALLVNGGSASAAELFAAAVQDTRVGKLFGETTYGKGTMQTLIPFGYTGGALRLTVAEYFSAGGRAVNNIGVSPDMTVTNKTQILDTSYFSDFDVTTENKLGDDSENVKALKQRLKFLGYFDGEENTVFDEATQEALKTYQTYRNLTVTGTSNLDTALDLNSIDYENLKFTDDLQFEAARDYLLNGLTE